MATTGFFLNQYFTTTLNVGGGIDNSQTTGIILTDVSGIDTSKPGVALINYADPLNTTIAEWVTFTSIDGSKELQGVVRGAEGFSAKSHDNGVSVAFPLSESHVNNLTTALSIGGTATNLVTTTLDEDTMSSNSATALATQQSIKAYVDTEVAGVASTDGWITTADTWTYASASTFTIAGVDRTATFTKGTRLKFTQTTVKYAVVVASSFSTDTTVTIAVNTDYTIANAAITSPFYSYQANPQGYTGWFSFTTTFGGFSANPSTSTIYYNIIGNKCSFYYKDGSDGTSNATTTTFTIPVPALRSSNHAGYIGVKDNGTIPSTPGHLTTTSSSATVSAYKTFSQGAWTSSGAKNIFIPLTTIEY